MIEVPTTSTDIFHLDQTSNTITRYYPSSDSLGTAIVLILPAMGVRASYYKPLAEAFSQQGFMAVLVDWRGQGKSSVRASRKQDYGYEQYIKDLKDVVLTLEDDFPELPIYICGHSLGGQIASLYASRYPKTLSGIILIASALVHYTGWNNLQPWKIKLAGKLFYPISQLVGYFPGNVIGFGGREASTVMKDWCHNALTGKYELHGSSFDYESAFKDLAIPVLAFSLDGDTFAPQKAVANLCAKYGDQSKVEHRHITRELTDLKALNHFKWVKYNDYFVETASSWILEKMKP